MNPFLLIVFLAVLSSLAWLGINALDKQGERRRQRAVQGSHDSPQQNTPRIYQENGDEEFSRSPVTGSPMLSVGRERNISEREVACHVCSWEGVGSQLSTGLVRIEGSRMYLYAYRCPVCGCFELSRKGKLLAFRSQDLTLQQQVPATENRHAGAEGRLSQWK